MSKQSRISIASNALAVLVALVAMLAVSGCSTKAKKPPQMEELQFLDSGMFDKQLSRTLGNGPPTVQVNFEGTGVSVNRIPERLDIWLQSVDGRRNSTVTVLPDPDYVAPRGLEMMALNLLMSGYTKAMELKMYWPTRQYDANVYYVPSEGTITRIVFMKKAGDDEDDDDETNENSEEGSR